MAARRILDLDSAGGGGAVGSRAREAAFAAAFRHSRRVRRLRVLVPLAAVLIFAGVVLVSWWDPLKSLNLPISVGAVSLSGSKVTMEAPRLTGFTNDNRTYRVNATRAAHDVTSPNIIDLSAIDAEMELEGGGKARVQSSSGVLDAKTGRVELSGEVSVTTTGGQAGRTTHALVDTRAGTIVSDKPVELESPRGHIAADRMEIRESGKLIMMEGRVRGHFTPEPPDPDRAGPADPAAEAPQGAPTTP